jgi:hypothetical protein
LISHKERTLIECLRKRSWGEEGQVRQRVGWEKSHCNMRGTVWMEKYDISFFNYTFTKYDFVQLRRRRTKHTC